MSVTFTREMLRALNAVPIPTYTQQQYDEFFSHPIWIALLCLVAGEIDKCMGDVFNSDNLLSVSKARGVVHGLTYLINSDTYLKAAISDDKEALEASAKSMGVIGDALAALKAEIKEDKIWTTLE